MKHTNHLGRRLLSLLLVLVMVVGLLPTSIFAEGETEYGTTVEAQDLKLTVTRSEEKGDFISGYYYSFEAKLYLNDALIDATDDVVTFAWSTDGKNYEDADSHNVEKNWGSYPKKVYVRATYDGITLSGEVRVDVEGSTEIPLEASFNSVETAYRGVAFTAPDKPDVTNVTGGTWETFYAIGEGSYLEKLGENYVPTTLSADPVKLAVLTLSGTSGTIYAAVEYKASIGEPVLTPAFYTENGAILDGWYTEDQVVHVEVTDNAGLADSKYLDVVTLNSADQDVEWTKDGNVWKSSSLDVTDEGTMTIGYGTTSKDIKIDKTEPTVSNVVSYHNQGKTTVTFDFTTGESGIAKVTINKKDMTLPDGTDGAKSGTLSFTLEGKQKNLNIVVTSYAGLSSARVDSEPQKNLAVEFTAPDVIGTSDKNYVAANAAVTIRVTGTEKTGPYSLDAKETTVESNDAVIAVTWEWKDGAWVASIPFALTDSEDAVPYRDLKDLTVSFYDQTGRNVVATLDGTYGVDNDAPEIEVSNTPTHDYKDETTGILYFKEAITYTVTVKDALLFTDSEGSCTITYTYVDGNGDEKSVTLNEENQAKITIEDGQRLTHIHVEATDATGNAAVFDQDYKVEVDATDPAVTVSISATDSKNNEVKVVEFYKKVEEANEKYFAVLDPAAKNNFDGTVSVTVTFTLTEKNPDTEFLTDNGWTEENGVWTKSVLQTVAQDQTGCLEFTAAAKDLVGRQFSNAGLTLKADKTGKAKSQMVSTMPLTLKTTTEGIKFYSAEVYIDRRTPTDADIAPTDAPAVTLKADAPYQTADGLDLFDDAFTFALSVTDGSDAADAGLASAEWSLDDGKDGEFLSTNESYLNDDGRAYIKVNIKTDEDGETVKDESNDVTLTVTVKDQVGNTYTYVKTFAVDNLAPRVKVTYDNNEAESGMYFKANRTATVVVEDLNFDAEHTVVTTEVAGSGWSTDGITRTATYVYDTDGTYSFGMTCYDLADNEAVIEYEGKAVNAFVVDKIAPSVKVTKTLADGAKYVQTIDGVDYYDGEITYTVEISDQYLSAFAGSSGRAQVSYTLEGKDETAVTGTTSTKDGFSGTYTFTLKDGQVLTGIQIVAVDNAGNPVASIAPADARTRFIKDEDVRGEWNYQGNLIAVDESAPIVTVQQTGTFVQAYQKTDYYSSDVTYDFTIQDKFLDLSGASRTQVYVTYADGTEVPVDNWELKKDDSAIAGLEIYTGSFTVAANGKTMTGIRVDVKDNAGNVPSRVTASNARTTFAAGTVSKAQAADQWYYTGNPVVADTLNPKASVTVDGNVESFYTNNGVAYIKLKSNGAGNSASGSLSGLPDETVKLTIRITDNNLTQDKNAATRVGSMLSGEEKLWSGTTQVNGASTLTYTKQITVKADTADWLKFDLTVTDLAGHAISEDDITVTPVNGTIPGNLAEMVKGSVSGGNFGTTFSVDRRRPSSADGDTAAPVITLTPVNQNPITTSSNGLELFSEAFHFNLRVVDGDADGNVDGDAVIENSGLASVSWNIKDSVGYIADPNVNYRPGDGVYAGNYQVNVTPTREDESNDVVLTVTAVDNVGNTTTYVKTFAVDTLAPRVTVSYDNNSVLNGKYFKDNRVATITVEDINFNESATKVTTQVGLNGWSANGSTHTAACAYTTDGDYTFDMTCADLANNAGEIKYVGEATKEFTVDKTAPVIHVTYNPSIPVGEDGSGVNYYDQDLGVTVAIDEVNFNAGEVIAHFNSSNTLNGWTSSGNTHTSGTTFTDGNNYEFSIAYTDLAGNPAATYTSETFSIDTGAPTIEITKGSMTTSELNIVQGNLTLGFTVNDAESNLKNFTVKVTQLNNDFQTVDITGSDYFTISGEGDRTNGYIDFTSIAQEKANDGVYTVQITAEDYAGHVVNLAPSLVFSLNRFGSTFRTLDTYTADFLTPSADGVVYQSQVTSKLVIQEINPNRVWQDSERTEEGSVVTIAVNGSSIRLEKGVDYQLTVTEEGSGSSKWYVYTYEIDPANFLDGENLVDGKYTILLYGEDEAGNKNTNEANAYSTMQVDAEGEYSGKIEFTLDHSAPIISILGIEQDKTYDDEFRKAEIVLSDNSPVGIQVYLNGELIELTEAGGNTTAWLALDEESGNYVLNIPEQNFDQSVRVVATDAAGNSAEQTVDGVLITSNWFVRAINNPVVVGGFILLVILLIVILILLLKKKKKNQDPTAAAV